MVVVIYLTNQSSDETHIVQLTAVLSKKKTHNVQKKIGINPTKGNTW